MLVVVERKEKEGSAYVRNEDERERWGEKKEERTVKRETGDPKQK